MEVQRIYQIVALLIIIVGTIIAALGGLWLNKPLVSLGLILTMVGAALQYITSKPFVRVFRERDWVQIGGDYSISIPAALHFRGTNVSATIYEENDGTFEAVGCGETIDDKGCFTAKASKPFRGKIVIR